MNTCKIRFENGDVEEEKTFEFRLHTMGRVNEVRSTFFAEYGNETERMNGIYNAFKTCVKGASDLDLSNADSYEVANAVLFFLRWTPEVQG